MSTAAKSLGMKKLQALFFVVPLLIGGLVVTLRAAPAPTPAPNDTAGAAQITVLYDAFGKPSAMQKDWGYSALIEYGGKRILFDTGNNPEILAQNVKASGVDLTKLDFVVMSHRHGDHMGGLTYLLKVNPTVKIYAPKEGLGGVYGSDPLGSFYRKDAVSARGSALLRRRAAGNHPLWIGLARSELSAGKRDH